MFKSNIQKYGRKGPKLNSSRITCIVIDLLKNYLKNKFPGVSRNSDTILGDSGSLKSTTMSLTERESACTRSERVVHIKDLKLQK